LDKEKILLIRLSSLGDVVHTLPAITAIKKARPDCFLGFVVEDRFKDLLEGHPLIDKLHIAPRKVLKESKIRFVTLFIKTILEIFREKYDVAIDLHNMLKSRIYHRASNARRRIGAGKRNWESRLSVTEFCNKPLDLNNVSPCVRASLSIIQAINVSADSVEPILPPSNDATINKVDELLRGNIDPSRKTIVLSPATTRFNKHWYEDNWSQLLDALESYNVIISGGPNDIELATRIIDKSTNKKVLNLCGKTNLKELIELFRRVDLVVSPDSGSCHLAWATSVPAVITIFCSTPRETFAPIGDKYFSFPKNYDCKPCKKRDCIKDTDRYICTKSVQVSDVLDTINSYLN